MNSFSFSPEELGRILVEMENKLDETDYTTSEPILSGLRVATIPESISFLTSELSKYKSINFDPMAAQITRNLAFAHRLNGEYPKWLELILQCLSPKYQRFLNSDKTQNILISHLERMESECSVFIGENHFSPFEITAGFTTSTVLPSQKTTVFLSCKSHLHEELKGASIWINLENEEKEECSILAFNDVCLQPEKKIVFSTILEENKEFTIRKYGKIKIANIKIVFAKNAVVKQIPGSKNVSREIVVLPFSDDIKYSVKNQAFGLVNQPFVINTKCERVPSEALLFSCAATIKEEGKAVFENGTTKQSFIIEKPKDSTIECEFKAFSSSQCTAKFSIEWNIQYGDEMIRHEETLEISFIKPFIPTFKIFGPNRKPLKTGKNEAPLLLRGTEYAFLTTFESNMKQRIVITNIEAKSEAGYSIKTAPLALPMNVSLTEAFTFVSFVSVDHSTESTEPGKILIDFTAEEASKAIPLHYEINYCAIGFAPTDNECHLIVPETKVDEEAEMSISIVTNSSLSVGVDVQLIAESNDFFKIVKPLQEFKLTKEEIVMKIPFVALEKGTRAFPNINLRTKEGISLWQSSPFVTTL